jgi:hypothetical protein
MDETIKKSNFKKDIMASAFRAELNVVFLSLAVAKQKEKLSDCQHSLKLKSQ